MLTIPNTSELRHYTLLHTFVSFSLLLRVCCFDSFSALFSLGTILCFVVDITHSSSSRVSLFSFLTDCGVVQDDDEDVVESLISPLSVCLMMILAGWLADSAVALLAESALRGRCV